MRVLVLGADGFIGRHISGALEAAGHQVVRGGRRPAVSSLPAIDCDFSSDLDPQVWVGRLSNIDAVVNSVGILRESAGNCFEQIHVAGPKALFDGCVIAGVRRVIQISALGSPSVGKYLASKHRGDAELTELDLDWTIVRPSLVYSVNGSYGGTSLLRAMAALPGVICVPESGEQRIQPIRAEDLGVMVSALVEGGGRGQIIAAVGPEPLTLLEYLQTVRRWLGFPTAVVVHIPRWLSNLVARLGEYFSDGPLGITMWRMLQAGNVGSLESALQMAALSGVAPLSVSKAFEGSPSYVQDRWHARLYFVSPVLRIALAIVWIGSGITGFLTPFSVGQSLLASAGISSDAAVLLISGSSTIDLVLGVLALVAWRVNLVAILMCICLLIYTFCISALLPSAWLDPFGGLLKNLALIPAVLVMGALSSRK
jgi:uncharacterized protein YbjT (DUF2867 family)